MKRNWLKDNRGAALVSVMIAVAFISILASALLYMSYSNYQMKIVNYHSKVNFYGTEKDMTQVSTSIRNEIQTASGDSLQALKDAVGYVESGAIARYNPVYLSKLAYPTVDLTGVTGIQNGNVTVGDCNAKFSSNVPSDQSNFIVEGTANDQKITLKGVVVEHTTTADGYVHKITTDLVFRVQKSSMIDDPGGIGEFSVLMDSPVSGEPSGGDATRATMYGNVFVGPGTYVYDGGVLNPAGATALKLTGESYYTQKGDYMVVFGNILLKDTAVLNVVSGRLTVFGDIIIQDNAAFLCTGEVYFPSGNKPGTTEPYGIKATNTHNVIPNTLVTDASAVKYLTEDNYNKMLETLKLDDSDTDNDGILNQILDEDNVEWLSGLQETKSSSMIDYYGVNYGIRFHKADTMNSGDSRNRLVFNATATNMQDGANLNATIISFKPVTIMNGKNMLLSQLGSDVFDMLTAESADESDFYNASVHKMKIKSNVTGGLKEENKVIGEFFVDNANQIVNNVLNHSTNGAGGEPQVDTAVGYSNWTKE